MSSSQSLDCTLQSLLINDSLEWIFVGGKGGVGKTTTSCALAIQMAQHRESVLLISTDPAHNVSDAFGQKFNKKPLKVKGFDNLFAMEIDASVTENTGFNIESETSSEFATLLPKLVSAFPGIDEAVSFGKLMTFIQSMSFSCIIFDTAPTGHTLRLLQFPTIIEEAFSSLSDSNGMLSSVMQMFNNASGKAEGGFLEELKTSTNLIRTMFTDASKTTFVCVCIPEFLSVYETERLILELVSHDIDASYIVCNRIEFPMSNPMMITDINKIDKCCNKSSELRSQYQKLAESAKELYNSHISRRKMQSKYLSQILDLYGSDFHVIAVPLHNNEIRGIELLKEYGKQLLTPKELPILEETD